MAVGVTAAAATNAAVVVSSAVVIVEKVAAAAAADIQVLLDGSMSSPGDNQHNIMT